MADPYLFPNGTLKNKLGIAEADKLAEVEADLTRQRLLTIEEDGPQGAFTFERLKATHCYIFQDVYAWAGHVRITRLAKREHVSGPIHHFTPPEKIDGVARAIFRDVQQGGVFKGLGRAAHALRAADLFGEINELHPFRDGNGRAQRAFIGALAREAGYELVFDVVSRERMIEASVAFHREHQGGPGMMRRLFVEISDPRRVEPLREATGFFNAQSYDWNDRYLATTEPGRHYEGTFVGRSGPHFLFHDGRRILVGQAADLPASAQQSAQQAESGAPITFWAREWSAGRGPETEGPRLGR